MKIEEYEVYIQLYIPLPQFKIYKYPCKEYFLFEVETDKNTIKKIVKEFQSVTDGEVCYRKIKRRKNTKNTKNLGDL